MIPMIRKDMIILSWFNLSSLTFSGLPPEACPPVGCLMVFRYYYANSDLSICQQVPAEKNFFHFTIYLFETFSSQYTLKGWECDSLLVIRFQILCMLLWKSARSNMCARMTGFDHLYVSGHYGMSKEPRDCYPHHQSFSCKQSTRS